MLVTLSGMLTLVSEAQYPNAYFPILVTLSGIFTLTRELQLKNAESPIAVTGSPLYAEETVMSVSVQVPMPVTE